MDFSTSAIKSDSVELTSACCSSDGVTCFSMSFILAATSLIVQSGVEAPAVIPTRSACWNHVFSTSRAPSMKCERGQTALTSSNSLRLLELSLPPTTNITSTLFASWTASSCRSRVAGQMVLRISISRTRSCMAAHTRSKRSRMHVVCDTTSARSIFGSVRALSSSATA